MNRERMRSPLGRALGLGSAKDGAEQWWLERVTAIALVPLTVWFAASIIVHMGSDYVTFIAWLQTPIATILMVLLLTGLFYHTALGLQVVDRGLRPFRGQVRGGDRGASWLLRTRIRRYRGHLAHRLQRLRGRVHAHRSVQQS
jgi:succinate dehydrogenase hydrophobic anchor subunit